MIGSSPRSARYAPLMREIIRFADRVLLADRRLGHVSTSVSLAADGSVIGVPAWTGNSALFRAARAYAAEH